MVCASVRRDNPRALTCTMISSVDLAHYRVSRAKDWVSVDCGTGTTKAYGVATIQTERLSLSFLERVARLL